MSPGTEFARDFCAGIGPLQLGVMLVLVCVFPTKTMEMIKIHKDLSKCEKKLHPLDDGGPEIKFTYFHCFS